MNIQSNASFLRPRAAALALAASLLWMRAPGAQAQWFSTDAALPPMQVERMVQASGYRLTGPVVRNGPVYLADVLGREDDRERLVIEANSGRLLQRYRAPGRRQHFATNDYWSGEPRPRLFGGWFGQDDDFAPRQQRPVASTEWPSQQRQQPAQSDGWFGRDEEVAPPRPPARITGGGGTDTRNPANAPAAAPHAPAANNVARADDGSAPYVILAPDHSPAAATHDVPLEKPRVKPQVRRKKPEPTPVAQPVMVPNVAKPASVAQPARPTSPALAAPPQSDAAKEPTPAPAPPAPRVADTKIAAPPAPAPVTASAAPVVTPTPKAPAHKPAVNDVPVDPLE
jgi:hypothetical protein